MAQQVASRSKYHDPDQRSLLEWYEGAETEVAMHDGNNGSRSRFAKRFGGVGLDRAENRASDGWICYPVERMSKANKCAECS